MTIIKFDEFLLVSFVEVVKAPVVCVNYTTVYFHENMGKDWHYSWKEIHCSFKTTKFQNMQKCDTTAPGFYQTEISARNVLKKEHPMQEILSSKDQC